MGEDELTLAVTRWSKGGLLFLLDEGKGVIGEGFVRVRLVEEERGDLWLGCNMNSKQIKL